MAETINAREANQNFSRLLREVAAGKEYVITRSGTPVATLLPVAAESAQKALSPERQEALDGLIHFALNHTVPEDAEPARVDREELYTERFNRPRGIS